MWEEKRDTTGRSDSSTSTEFSARVCSSLELSLQFLGDFLLLLGVQPMAEGESSDGGGGWPGSGAVQGPGLQTASAKEEAGKHLDETTM